MKKFLLALGVVALLGTSQAVAGFIEGKVSKVAVWPDVIHYFLIDKNDATCEVQIDPRGDMTAEKRKEIYAAMLTAQSASKTVRMWTEQEIDSGTCGNTDPLAMSGFEIAD